ncbi:MAG: YncE family protein [Gemmatimonadota bacterium]
MIAGDTLAGVLVNDTTMRVEVPVLDAGEYPVRLLGTGFGKVIAEVVVHGLIDVRPAPRIDRYPMLWPSPSLNPTLLANQDDHLAFIDLRTGLSVAFPDSVHSPLCVDGPGPTYDASRILLARKTSPGGCHRFDAWTLSPDLKLTRVDTAVVYGTLAAQISRSVTMGLDAHDLWTTGGTGTFRGRYEDTRGFRLCPRGNIATIVMAYTISGGLPFFDGTTGLLRFEAPQIVTGNGAAFTPARDTVYVAGQDNSASTRFIIGITTADGRQFAVDTIPEYPTDLALDPSGRWLFVLTADVILVIDRPTLKPVGRMSNPILGYFPLALSGAYQELYAVDWAHVARFDIAMP